MKRTPPAKLQKLHQLAQDGLPDRTIGECLDMSPHTVRRWRRTFGLVSDTGVNRYASHICPC